MSFPEHFIHRVKYERSIPPKHKNLPFWLLPEPNSVCRYSESNQPEGFVVYEDLPQFQDLQAILTETFACEAFRDGQLPAINAAITGYDAIITLNTSAGKSLCFQLPAIYGDKLTVVFSPTVALIEDQIKRLHELKESEEEKNSLVIRSHSKIRQEYLIVPERGKLPKLFYVCPEWLGKEGRRRTLHQWCEGGHIARFVIDESHMALRKFRECYRHVFQLRQLFPTIPFTLVSASTTQNELEVLTKELKMHGTCLRVLGPLDRLNIHYSVIHVPARQSQYRLNFIADYIRNHPRQCGLVFVRTRAQAEKVAEKLQSLLKPDSVVVDYYHGRASHKLSSILDRWHRDQIDVVVCTCSFAEGIDKNNVRFVFHYHLPPTMAAYAQETGRAGRDGKPSHCILFHSFSDLSLAANIIAEKVDNQRFLSSSQREDLQQVINFSYDFLTCRRYHILAPFQVGNNRAQNGEQWLQNVLERQQGIPNCSLCDNCDDLQRKRKHFKHLSHQEIVQIENCFKSDMELPKHQLVSQVADNMNYSVLRAKEIVEFLAAAGVLKLEFCSQEGDQDDLRPMLSKSSRLIRDISWLPPPPAPDRITKSGVLKSVSNLASGPEKPIGGESTQEEFDSDTEGDANEESDEHQHDGIEAVKEMPVSDSSSYTRIRIPRRRFEESDSASPSDSAASPDFHPDDLGKPQKLVDEFRKVISKQTDVQRLHLTPEQLTGIIEAIIRETTRREDQYLDEDRLANIIERCTSSKGKKIQLLGVHISQRDICEHLIREVFAGFHVAKRVRQS